MDIEFKKIYDSSGGTLEKESEIEHMWGEWVQKVFQDVEEHSLKNLDPELISEAPDQQIAEQFCHTLAQSLDVNYENWHKNLSNWSIVPNGENFFIPNILDILEKKWLDECGSLSRNKDWYYRFGQIAERNVRRKGIMLEEWLSELTKTQPNDETSSNARASILNGYVDYLESETQNRFKQGLRYSFGELRESEHPEDKKYFLDTMRNTIHFVAMVHMKSPQKAIWLILWRELMLGVKDF